MTRKRHADGYSLHELTDITGLTARTVRYYVAEGLLPPPVAAGPRSYYSEAHLQRLRLIGYLKDAFLPLREIRRRHEVMDDAETAAAVADYERAQEPQPGHEGERDAQAGILSHTRDDAPFPFAAPALLNGHLADGELDSDGNGNATGDRVTEPSVDHLEPQAWPFVPTRPGEYEEPVPRETAWRLPRPIKAAQYERHPSTTWRKLEIGDSAEFLVEERLYQRRKEQVDALVAWAQRILDGGN